MCPRGGLWSVLAHSNEDWGVDQTGVYIYITMYIYIYIILYNYIIIYTIIYYDILESWRTSFIGLSQDTKPFHACSCVGTFTTGLRGRPYLAGWEDERRSGVACETFNPANVQRETFIEKHSKKIHLTLLLVGMTLLSEFTSSYSS